MTQEIPNPQNRTVEGGCFCAAVRFSIDLPSKWCAHCHCSMCRRIHGAGYVTWVGVNSEHFRLLADGQLQWYTIIARCQTRVLQNLWQQHAV